MFNNYQLGSAGSRVNLADLPKPNREYVINFDTLDGGLNIYDLDYRLKPNESPYMKNLHWKDGALGCRPGQVRMIEPTEGEVGYAAYDDLFWGYVFVHVDDEIRCFDPKADNPAYTVLHSNVPLNRGMFFRYGDNLLYKNKGGFYQIRYDPTGTTPATTFPCDALGEGQFKAEIPITLINADPATAAGDLYQPENRISPDKEVWYNAASGVTDYHLPVVADSVEKVVVDGVTLTTGWSYSGGVVHFDTAPPVTNPPTNNTVSITYRKANTDAYNSVMDCPYAIVYGGDQNLCVVVGGCPAQPNAYFWSGNDELVMRATYWPMEHYNFAGDTESEIMGFGKQQGFLVIFSTKGVGRASFGTTTTTTDRLQIEMPYTRINSKIGCDYPWSIQLVENNLVFCNAELGVCMLLDSSAAYENNILQFSRKVNGTARRAGLLNDVRAVGRSGVYSTVFEDNYWLVANEHAYVWDYELSAVTDPSWFYYDNIQGVAFINHVDEHYHVDAHGGATVFQNVFSDYNEAIDKVYRFAVQHMGGYDRLKDVESMMFVVRSDTNTFVNIQYQTDYEERYDLTPIASLSWSLMPWNLDLWYLGAQKYAHVERRRPRCRHVRHFTAELSNNVPGSDLSVVSAQVFYNYQGRQM